MDADHAVNPANPVSGAPRPGDDAAAGGRSASCRPAAAVLPVQKLPASHHELPSTTLTRIRAAHPDWTPPWPDADGMEVSSRGDVTLRAKNLLRLEQLMDEQP